MSTTSILEEAIKSCTPDFSVHALKFMCGGSHNVEPEEVFNVMEVERPSVDEYLYDRINKIMEEADV